MGNPRRDPLPDFDTSYIDQLLSASNPSAKKEAPLQQAAPTTPKPAKPVTPAKPVKPAEPTEPEGPFFPGENRRPVIYLLLLIAVVCLLAGFFLGRWTVKANPDSDETLGTYIYNSGGTNPGIAEDYTAMSTEQLVNIAVRISELSSYGSPVASTTLPPDVYRNLRLENPVLTELEQRPDAITELHSKATTSAVSTEIYAANALASYYTLLDNLPSTAADGPWKVAEDEYVTIYEYTEAPKVSFTSTDQNNCTIFEFDGDSYLLTGNDLMSSNQGEPNFWFRIERQPDFISIPQGQSRPSLSISNLDGSNSTSGTWAKIQHYDKGWFVYGHAKKPIHVSFDFATSAAAASYQHYVTLTAFPDWELGITPTVAETILKCKELIGDLATYNPDCDLAGYPLIRELLSREDGLTFLLRAAAGERASQLVNMPVFRDRMTDTELVALKILSGQSDYIHAFRSETPLLTETPTGIRVNSIYGERVGSTPSSLKNIPLSEMNCWIHVSLNEGALPLWQRNWVLEAKTSPGHTIGVWELYNDYNQLTGWIVSGKLTESDMVWLRLVKDNTLLQKTDVDYRVTES